MPSIVRLVPVLALLVITVRVPAAVAADAPHLSLTIAHQLIQPGEKQTVTVVTAPRRMLTLSVTLPNGATFGQHGSSSAKGRLRFTFVQPANALSRYSRVAIVHVSLDDNPARSVEGAYRVAFAAIDLVVPSQPIPENSNATVWVHTRPRTLVEVWDDLWDWPQEVKGTTVTIDAHALIAGRSVDTTATVTVQGFAFMSWVVLTQILHLQNGAWVATTQVRVGEEFRVTATGFLNEPAGTFVTFAPGTVTIRKVETVLASGALQSELGNFDEYAEFRLTDPADVGPLEAVVDDHPTTGGLPFTLVAAQQ
jgi:hypothetical protein